MATPSAPPPLRLLLAVAMLPLAACGGQPAEQAPPAPPPAPWLGDAAEPADPQAIRPFTIAVPDAVLDDLQARLARTRLPDEIDGAGWDYGTPLGYLTELIAYWRDEYDWRAQEARLNAFDHFKTRIDGIDIHFIHQRSAEPDALPLIVTHGWPGSVAEFMEVIGPLTDPAAHGGSAEDAFHVVAPSMPGYGFSGHPRGRGVGPEQTAAINAQLMARLGYERYGVQGGDWGANIGRWHAVNHPGPVVGLHVNLAMALPPPDDVPPGGNRLRDGAVLQGRENGYSHIQGTKPQTLGYGLTDSPAGQAAWIVEKFRTWCECDGHPETIFSRDALLTNIMLYWVSGSGPSSARMYYEAFHAPTFDPPGRVEAPTGVAIYPGEPFNSPREWVEAWYNLQHWAEMPRGGHFAAMEQPELFVDDVRTFFAALR